MRKSEKANGHIINNTANKFKDIFSEQIKNYLITYNIEATEATIKAVILEIGIKYIDKENNKLTK